MINKERLENFTQEVWEGAIKLRGKFKAKDYPSGILPMIMIRRIECVLEEKLNNQITTLQSYRKRLINECVTGKKQVFEGELISG